MGHLHIIKIVGIPAYDHAVTILFSFNTISTIFMIGIRHAQTSLCDFALSLFRGNAWYQQDRSWYFKPLFSGRRTSGASCGRYSARWLGAARWWRWTRPPDASL